MKFLNIKIITIILLMMVACINKNSEQKDNRGYIVKVGDIAPDFEMNFIDGGNKRLSDLRGKVIMLQFTASWCGVCRKEMPFIEDEIWQFHKDENFVVIGIDRDESLEKVQKFIKDTGVSYPISLDPGANIFQLFAKKEAGVTRNVIIDKSGKIVFLTRLFERKEFNAMKEKISSLLKG